MKLNDGVIIFATEEARKKWEGKEPPRKTKKNSCPSCGIDNLKKDCINKENKQE
jgi:hypothetical protein